MSFVKKWWAHAWHCQNKKQVYRPLDFLSSNNSQTMPNVERIVQTHAAYNQLAQFWGLVEWRAVLESCIIICSRVQSEPLFQQFSSLTLGKVHRILSAGFFDLGWVKFAWYVAFFSDTVCQRAVYTRMEVIASYQSLNKSLLKREVKPPLDRNPQRWQAHSFLTLAGSHGLTAVSNFGTCQWGCWTVRSLRKSKLVLAKAGSNRNQAHQMQKPWKTNALKWPHTKAWAYTLKTLNKKSLKDGRPLHQWVQHELVGSRALGLCW